jgi:hypothetical protein
MEPQYVSPRPKMMEIITEINSNSVTMQFA